MAAGAAQGKVVRVGGGANVLRQFMAAGLLDEIHTVQAPINLGSGELFFSDPGKQLEMYESTQPVMTASVRHLTYIRK